MKSQPLSAQQGAATILMSVLVGFSITAMALALMFNVQNAQDKQLTAQAQVSAQNLAWAGSETFRQLLTSLPLGVVDNLPLNEALTALDKNNVQGLQGRLTPTVVFREAVAAANGVPKHKEITVNLASVNGMAGVGTTLQMVYGIFNEPALGLPVLSPLTFYHDADIQAVADFKNKTTAGATITIKGSVTLTNQVTGLDNVEATGDVTINNNKILLKEVKANGTVTLSGDTKVLDSVIGLAKVNILAGFAGKVESNGDIIYRSSAPDVPANNTVSAVRAGGSVSIVNLANLIFTEIGSVKDTTLSNCSPPLPAPPAVPQLKDLICFKTVEAGGLLTSDPSRVENAYSKTEIACQNRNPPASVQPLTEAVAPKFTGCATTATDSKFTQASPTLKSITALEPVVVTPLVVDVWEHEADANYVVRYDGTKTLVTVKNVTRGGAALSGDFRFVYDSIAKKGYLCATSITDAACKTAFIKNVICTGDCWSVGPSTGDPGAAAYTFSLGGVVAPGVYIFDGNLSLKFNAISSAAYLVAGYIDTQGNTGRAAALNFAGRDGGTFAGTKLGGVCNFLADTNLNLIPSNFCAGGYDSTAAKNLGNVALMAGGYPRTSNTSTTATYQSTDKASETKLASTDAQGRTKYTITRITPNAPLTTTTQVMELAPYRGGDIKLAADNLTFGSIVAGNMLESQGTSTVYGYVVSAALARTAPSGGGSVLNEGGLKMTMNKVTSSTTIDNTLGPSTFDGKVIPGSAGNAAPPATSNDVRVLRSRYL